MCGIAGYLGRFEAEELDTMSLRVAHRGPDGDGVWISDNRQVGLSHRRLSIIDLSSGASQPMIEDDVVLIYNGELYNYRELRQQMIQNGIRFRTRSDTEVILKMYLWKGVAMLHSLNGIFAFAIWDKRSKTLFAARDGVGVKPFYYTQTPRGLLFSSEMKSFLDIPDVDWTIDPAALQSYMTYHWSPGERTMVKSVLKLLPGHAFIARSGRIERMWSFYDLPYASPIKEMNEREAISLVHDSVRDAVRRQMVADVPVGAFLSGGLDSSAVVAFAKDGAQNGQLPCFTIRFDRAGADQEGMTDDLPYAHHVAKHLGVELQEVSVGPDSLHRLTDMIYMMDEPQADVSPINAYLISSVAREQGIKVLLSGMGGDDIFTGYRRHYALEQEKYWRWLPGPARYAVASVAHRMPVRIPLMRQVRKAFSYAHLPQDDRIASYFFWGHPDLVSSMLSKELKEANANNHVAMTLMEALGKLPPSTPLMNKMLYLDGKFFVPDHNLNFFDKVSMACGVECRVPLLDIDLIRDAASLPVRFKQAGHEGKWVFKKAMEAHLPREVIYRPKTGFGMPLRVWMREELKDLQEDLLSPRALRSRGFFEPKAVQELRAANEAGRIDATYTLLSMMSIELWSRIFLDRSIRPSIPTVSRHVRSQSAYQVA